jgi:hypothetical protein
MHQTAAATALWLAIIGMQAILAIKGRGLDFLKHFLAAQSVMGCILFTINCLAGHRAYLYSWCSATVVHHGLCAFLTYRLYLVVRERGLPSRQSPVPIYIMAAGALLIGLRYAGVAAALITNATVRLVLPLDHAFSFAVVCLLSVLPLYSAVISSTIPKQIYLVIAGFALYEATYAGKVGFWITSHVFVAHHAADFAYLISLSLWYLALNSPIECRKAALAMTTTTAE